MTLANDSILVTCRLCGVDKPQSEFYLVADNKSSSVKRLDRRCKVCMRERCKQFRRGTLAARLVYSRNYEQTHQAERRAGRESLRVEAIKAYGGVCACCGEDELVFLAIDHINGSGRAHRKTISNHTSRWLKANNYPSGFQVLCHNCNWAKTRGVCPHENMRQKTGVA